MELIQLSQADPDAFTQLIQTYPQLAQMLQEDMQNMNGGIPNEMQDELTNV